MPGIETQASLHCRLGQIQNKHGPHAIITKTLPHLRKEQKVQTFWMSRYTRTHKK